MKSLAGDINQFLSQNHESWSHRCSIFRRSRLAHQGADLLELGSAGRLAPFEQGRLGRGQRGPARLHPLAGRSFRRSQTASADRVDRHVNAAGRPANKSSAVCWMQTWASMPAKSTLGRSSAARRSAISPHARQLKPTLPGTGSQQRSQVPASVGPSPLGYCSVASTGTPENLGALDQPADVPHDPPSRRESAGPVSLARRPPTVWCRRPTSVRGCG